MSFFPLALSPLYFCKGSFKWAARPCWPTGRPSRPTGRRAVEDESFADAAGAATHQQGEREKREATVDTHTIARHHGQKYLHGHWTLAGGQAAWQGSQKDKDKSETKAAAARRATHSAGLASPDIAFLATKGSSSGVKVSCLPRSLPSTSSSFSSARSINTRPRLRRLERRVGVTAWSSASDRPRGAPGPRVSARRAGAALGSRGRERRRSRRLLQKLWRPRSRGISCAPLIPSSQH